MELNVVELNVVELSVVELSVVASTFRWKTSSDAKLQNRQRVRGERVSQCVLDER